jgi:hypothetical protein
MVRRHLELSEEARGALITLRDSSPKAYLRERAAALIKIADGTPAAVVARQGLLRPRKPDTLYDWLTRYEQEGIAGLIIRAGRGRKPAFFRDVPGPGRRPAARAAAARP